MSPDLEAIKARCDAATRGPWAWRGHSDGAIELRTTHSGGLRVITTMRSEPCLVELDDESVSLTLYACEPCRTEAKKTLDPFVDYRCSKPENLDTVWLWDEGFVSPANKWAVQEVTYRTDVARVDHPDAEFIAHARTDVPALVAEVERLQAAVALHQLRVLASGLRVCGECVLTWPCATARTAGGE